MTSELAYSFVDYHVKDKKIKRMDICLEMVVEVGSEGNGYSGLK